MLNIIYVKLNNDRNNNVKLNNDKLNNKNIFNI